MQLQYTRYQQIKCIKQNSLSRSVAVKRSFDLNPGWIDFRIGETVKWYNYTIITSAIEDIGILTKIKNYTYNELSENKLWGLWNLTYVPTSEKCKSRNNIIDQSDNNQIMN